MNRIFSLPRCLLASISISVLFACSAYGQGSWDTYSDTWVATDALGRTLPNAEVVGAPRTNRTVAMFYYLWHGFHYTDLHIIPDIIAADPDAIHEFDNPLWGPEHAWHFWGKPLFGHYFMDDSWVVRHHIQMFTDAGVDVVILEATNGFEYKIAYDNLFNILQDMLANGQDVPKIAFMTKASSGATSQRIYDDIYATGRHSNLWFYWEGKPLILGVAAEMSSTVQNFFTVRYSWAFDPGDDTWGWLERYPQHGGWSGDPSNLEQIPVSSGAHPHDPNGGDGKSNHINIQPENIDLDTELGIKFTDQWRRARELDPQVVLVTQWNEWTAMRFRYEGPGQSYAKRPLYTGDPWFIDVYNQEYNRDLEPMQGGHGDNFYYQLADNIRRYKGVGVAEPASSPTTIALADFSSWDSVAPEFRDDQDDVHHRDHRGYGSEYYINTTGRNDIRRCKVARDEANVYLFVETVDPITPQSTGGGWWMNCFIRDESSGAPGWEGYHFGLSNDNPSSGKLFLWQSTGGWNWVSLGEVDIVVNGNQLAVSIPRSLLGLPANSTFVHLTFKWADNQQGNTADSWLLNGDAAPNARFRYRYWAGGGADTPVHGKTYRLINRNSLDVATPNGHATTSGIEIKTGANQFGLNQKWTTFQLAGGQWALFNAEAAGVNDPDNLLAIETPNVSGTDGELLKNSTYGGLDQQHWNFIPQGDGWYRIVNEATGQALSQNPVGMLAQTSASADFNQQWSFELVAPVDSGGKYRLLNRKSNLLADVDGHSMNPGTDMVQQAATGEWNQEWVVYGQGADRIQMTSEESRRPLESPNASAGADLTQGSWAADDLQTWEMRMAEPGFFQFVNTGSGHAMGLQGGSTVPGTKLVQQADDASSMDQQWHLSTAKSTAAGLFLDTFATGDTSDENQDYATRQAGGLVIGNYTATAEHFSISGGKLKNLGPGGYLTMNANMADYLIGEDFELSFKLTVLDTTANWSSIYLTSANENERGLSRLGMYALGSGNATQVYVLYRGVGVRGIEVVTLDDLNTLFLPEFGQAFDRTAEHAIQFVSTADTGITNQYDFVVDGITVKSGLQYAFTEDTVRQIEIVGLSTVGGVYYDDIALRISPPGISYSSWTDANNLDGAYALRDADPDEDGMDNLLEYAMGGNPNLDDAAIRLPSYLLAEDGGSNVFKYVYNRRRDAFERGLHYGILLKDDLVEDVAWSNIYDTAEAGTNIIDSSFESVTNDIPVVDAKKFVGLEVVED